MKKVIFLIAIVSIAILSSNCKSNLNEQISSNTQDTASIKAEIERILKVQDDAYAQHDEDGNRIMQSTCEDSLLYVGNDGGIMLSSYDYSHDLADGWIERPHDKIFKFYNNTIIVTSIYKSYNILAEDTIFLNNRMTKVFVKDNNHWKMAHIGISPLPVSYFKESSNNNPAVYNDYAGTYQMNPKLADTVILINGKLYIRSNTDSKRVKLFPLNDSTFMSKDFTGKIIFGKSASGKVTHEIFEFPDGQRIHIPKVK